ncbi:MAG: heme ABC transporter ATP-binding protein [Bacteroidetes bacterium]|nr:heme ABC transporter ATP-binding protein [Bacteroidota bacterium]
MLSTRDIQFQIGKKTILKGISIDFLPGEFAMILGPNGSGKSSFLKIFSGQTDVYNGSVQYDNTPLKNISKEKLAKFRAVMSQQPELNFPLSVGEVVMMGRYPHFDFTPTKNDHHICNEVMNQMNLHGFKDRNYITLSGGEKQRVQYARVLAQIWESPANGCRYLFLDEPLNNLDINYQQQFLQLAKIFKSHNTVLIAVMHDINLALQHADKLIFLKDGELVVAGPPAEVVNEQLIEHVFGVKSTIIENPLTRQPLLIFE